MDINKTILIGRLTKDADISYTPQGTAISNFSIAVDHMKKKEGAQDTSFFQCKAFGKLAEGLKPYLLKGKQVGISAFAKQERWEKDGQKQSRVIFYCEEIELLGGNQNNSNGGYNNNDDYGYGN